MTTEKVIITASLDHDTVTSLDQLAALQNSDRSDLITLAVVNHVRSNHWKINRGENAGKESNTSSAASDEGEPLIQSWSE